WVRMVVLGSRAAMAFSSASDIKDWSSRVALDPARIPPDYSGSEALDDARARLATHAASGLSNLVTMM
nr:pyridine nucleotide-disulfide oxidoreductase [Aeromicrobium sp.]